MSSGVYALEGIPGGKCLGGKCLGVYVLGVSIRGHMSGGGGGGVLSPFVL